MLRSASQFLERIPGDVTIAAAVATLQLGVIVMIGHNQEQRVQLDAVGVALLLAGPAALMWRRSHPLAVLAATYAVSIAYWSMDYPRGPAFLALMAAFATAIIYGHRAAAWLSLAGSWFGFLWLPAQLGNAGSPSPSKALGVAAWLFVFGAAVELIAFRKERMQEAERARRQEELTRAGQERLRIARELHDVLAHNVSLINVQAGTALHLLDREPERARPALEAIKEASSQTLREVRSVLQIVRGQGEQAPLAPTVGVVGLDDLIARTSAAGISVRCERTGEPQALPASVDLAVYRIVQEALTNVARHARPASAVVRLGFGAGEFKLEVEDDGPGPLNGYAAGNGIAGMRERVAALGGDFSAGPRNGAGFRVAATLPLGAPE
jgi:signal transduction histidine kinase